MAKLDPRIEAIRAEYDLSADDFWQIPQNKQWVCKHAALEVVAAKAGITFDLPQILEANGANGVAAVCVSAAFKDRREWSIGEASPKNSKNAYPWAMAEKRAKDRVILKLVGIHGLVYSDAEIDTSEVPTMATPEPKGESRTLFTTMMHDLREAGARGRAALRAYWTSEEFQAAWETLPLDWRAELEAEKNGFLASYPKPTGRVDPNHNLDQQYAQTMQQ